MRGGSRTCGAGGAGGDQSEKLPVQASEYGLPYAIIVKEGGYPVKITSRQSIEVVRKFVSGYWHGGLHIRTYVLNLIASYLSPFSWKFRLNEAKKVANYIESKELKRYMVMGKFSFSPFDADELETYTLLKKNMLEWDKKNPKWGNMRGRYFDYSELSQFFPHWFAGRRSELCSREGPYDLSNR